jgi:Zn finger protein HypA/HybF involved in hydrogenase expression
MEAQVTAIRKFNCKACGAEAVWTPAKHKLVCPYCGIESEHQLKQEAGIIRENELLPALKKLPTDSSWMQDRKSVKCQSCHAISLFHPQRTAQSCDFCGSPSLISVQDNQAPVQPSSQLPFKVAESQVRESIRNWYASHWLAPNALGDKALTDTLHGIYLPYWTFDAQVQAEWQAESGEYYYTKDSRGNTQQHVRWHYSSGSEENFFDDLLVPASRGVHPELLSQISPFPTATDLLDYDTGYLSGWVVEQYQIDLHHASHAAQQRMEDVMHDLCARSVPGDTYRGLQVHSHYSGQTFKHVLLPVWLLTYTYGTRSYQVAVNGYTGKIHGEHPISWVKVLLLTIAALLLIGTFIYFSEQR